jgi:hypothetical protein
MSIIKLYLVETPGDGRAFSVSPVNTTGSYLGGPRLYELPEGYEAVADPGADPVILDDHGRTCKLTTVPLQSGSFIPVLETLGAFNRSFAGLTPVTQPQVAMTGR